MGLDVIYTEDLEPMEGFELRFEALIEYDSPDWDFESEEERKKLIDDINNGHMEWFCAHVIASIDGIQLGHTYLGGCCYKSYAEFLKEEGANLAAEAIKAAKETLHTLAAKEKLIC